jgi:hypothetical protein
MRRPTSHRKAGGQGSIAVARIFDFVPARAKWLPGSPSGGQGFNQETSAMRAIRRKLGFWFNSNSGAIALFSSEL